MKKRILALLLALCMIASLAACGGADDTEEPEETVFAADETLEPSEEAAEPAEETVSADAGSWSIYWYLCGSDLESDGGFATGDLSELLEVQLPEDVNVVIETGGASVWQNDVVDASKLQRWVYNSEGLQLIDEQPSASMGQAQTLADFLQFAKTNYPAERTAVLFWNHGCGSVSGAAFDELYELDSLTLDEMYAAFSSVWSPSADEQPLELIGFDTCLMATVDVAYTFSDIAKYLVASEETEPANGWYYSQWVGALAQDPSMDGAQLGEIICDAYMAGCEAVGTQDNTTLSVTDLSKVGTLLSAYETFGAEALSLHRPGVLLTVCARSAAQRKLRRQHQGAGLHQHGRPRSHGAADGRYASFGAGGAGRTGRLRAVSGERAIPHRGDRPFVLLLL